MISKTILKNNLKVTGKKGAMEMSMGTLVTIVLLMTVLVLGLVMVRTIFSGATESVKEIDQSVKNEIQKLFSENDNRKVVVHPASRLIKIKKGDEDAKGFALSIRNTGIQESTFSYSVSVKDLNIRDKCSINAAEAEGWIVAGGSGTINIPAGSIMTEPEFVRFMIPDDAPPCLIRYSIEVKKDGQLYTSDVSVDLEIKSS